MSKPAAIMGSLTDVRNIAANKSVRLSIEVAAERAHEVLTAFGWPTNVNPIPVAIARLDPAKATPEPAKAQDKPKRHWGELSHAQRAGIRCNEPGFWRFLEQRFKLVDGRIADELTCADYIRIKLKIKSRAELVPGSEATAEWHALDGDYEAWLRYGATA